MKKFSVLCFFLICLYGGTFAQASGNYNYNNASRNSNAGQNNVAQASIYSDEVVLLDIKALMNVEADAYLAIFNVTQVGETVAEIEELMNNRHEKLLEQLAAIGITEEQVFFDMVSLVPVYAYSVEEKIFSRTYNEVPVGFEMQKNIHISYSDPLLLDQIITATAQNEIYELVKVEYFVDDIQKVYDTLRTRTIDEVAKRIEDYRQLGIDLDNAFFVFDDDIQARYPADSYTSYESYNSQSINALGKRTNVNQHEKTQHLFYQPVAYNDFDIVINPRYREPVVQFTYHLLVRYAVEKPAQPQPEKETWLLTPDGQLKRIEP